MTNLIKLKLELAKAMAKFSEFETDKGPLYSENDWITTAVPVYVYTEDAELIPAPDGEYTTPEIVTTYKNQEVFTVVDGIVTEVKSINSSSETSEVITTEVPTEVTEETPAVLAEETPVVEEVVTEEVPAEDDAITKLMKMVQTLVEEVTTLSTEMESIKSELAQYKADLTAITTSMANLSEQRRVISITDSNKTKSKDVHPIFGV